MEESINELKNKNVDSSKSDKFIKKFNKVMKKLKEIQIYIKYIVLIPSLLIYLHILY